MASVEGSSAVGIKQQWCPTQKTRDPVTYVLHICLKGRGGGRKGEGLQPDLAATQVVKGGGRSSGAGLAGHTIDRGQKGVRKVQAGHNLHQPYTMLHQQCLQLCNFITADVHRCPAPCHPARPSHRYP